MSIDHEPSIRALIASVGGTIEPLVKTVQSHRPELVVFFASEQTVELIGAIKDRLRESDCQVTDRKIVTRDPEDLVICYAEALRCADLVQSAGFPASQVAVDFTGGTKVMSAALALATVGRGFTFAYIGGKDRSKAGRGVVVTGSEWVVRRADPFAVYAVEERKRLALFFRAFQFKAAQAVVASLLANPLSEPDRLAFLLVRDLAEGYAFWERFEYGQALRVLGRCQSQWSIAVRANPMIRYAGVLPVLDANVHWLQRMAETTVGFTRYGTLLVEDMIANADRRATEGSYDDAIVRLYRAMELAAQAAIQRRLGCGTDRVPVAAIPDPVRAEFRTRYRERDPGHLEIPLEGGYRLLAALDEPEGRCFERQIERFKKVQSARNSSWLAHGMSSGSEQAYRNLRSLVREIVEIGQTITFVTLDEP